MKARRVECTPRQTAQRRSAWKIALAGSAALGGIAAQSLAVPIIRQNFTATAKPVIDEDFNVVEPPDTMGAVGIDHYAQFLNGTFSVYNKSNHAEIVNISDVDFWSNAGISIDASGVSDPRIIFDPNSKRWFATQIDFTADEFTGEVFPDNNILLAVSRTSNPAGAWTGLPTIPCDPGHTLFGDFPRLGFDANGVYIVTDNYQTSPEVLEKINIVSIPKADLVGPSPTLSRMTQFGLEDPSARGYSAQPVLDLAATSAHGVLLAIDNENLGQLNRTTINNTGGAGATLSSSVDIFVAPTTQPPGAKQLDSSTLIETNDDRISGQVVKVGNALWAVQETGYPTTSHNPRSALRWYQINETTNALMQPEGTVYDPNFDFYMPSIAANQFGDVVMGFTRSGTTQYAGAYAMVGSTNSVTGITTFGAPILLQDGLMQYEAEAFGLPNRWGDYSSTTVDPADPFIFWTIQEYAEEDLVFGVAAWGTHVDEIIVPHANEARWTSPADGTFSTGSNWLTGVSAGSADHAIFSVASAPSLTGYTVSFGGSISNTRASVRQGMVSFNLAGQTYTLTGSDPANPSLSVGEFGGNPQLTVSGGTLQSVNTLVGAGTADALMVVTAGGTTWNNTGSVFVGGTNSAAAGKGTLRIQSSAAVTIGGTLKAWANGRIEYNGGSLLAGGINLAGGGKLVAASGGGTVVRTGTLAIDTANQSQLDLSNNKLIATTATLGSWNGTNYDGITGLIKSGRNGGAWNGGGIITSQSNAISPNYLTTLAVATAGAAGKTTFGGISVNSLDVLVMYTYAGDANLSGGITGDDYFRIDNGFASSLTGYFNGDFDYSGKINADDYFLIDSNYSRQGSAFASGALPDAITAVPEPISLGLMFALFAFTRPRARRRSTVPVRE